MASKNYYEEIGVSPNATTEEITNAVRQIVKSNNPEHFTDAKDREAAQQLLKFIKQIYETLKDENLRWDYDIALFDESEDIDFGKINFFAKHGWFFLFSIVPTFRIYCSGNWYFFSVF